MARQRARRQRSAQLFPPNAAGIDCGATEPFVAVPEDRAPQPGRSFHTFTADLHALADWLPQCGIDTVAMESPGVYWMPLCELREARGLQVSLVDPGKIKNAPGRKTDVVACQGMQPLQSVGLLSASFRPDDDSCLLRSSRPQRDMLGRDAAHHVQPMHKALMEMNVPLPPVMADLTGLPGPRIIAAILGGERAPDTVAKLRDGHGKQEEATIARALQGHWRDDHLCALHQADALSTFYRQHMAPRDTRREASLPTFEAHTDGHPLAPCPRKRPPKPNEPPCEMTHWLSRMTGVELTPIDGMGGHLALGIIAEIGTDRSSWAREKHFASWLCLAPGQHTSGGKHKRSKTGTRPSANRANPLLRRAARSLSRSDSALGAFYRRRRGRRGAPKAITATAHKLAKIVSNRLKQGKAYVDRGAQYDDHHDRQRAVQNVRRRAEA